MHAHEDLDVLLRIPWLQMIGWGLFFYLGVCTCGSMFAAVGASVEQESDAQYLLLRVMLPLMFSYILNIQILYGNYSRRGLFIRSIYSSYYNDGEAEHGSSVVEVAISALILIVSVFLMIKLAAKI